MRDEYSLEQGSNSIYNSKTKNHFQEVLSSYYNGNYRSAIVMLWTVVVCDIIYKLEDLETLYQDPGASAILKTIRDQQNKNPNSPAWEDKLLMDVKTKTQLINEADFIKLEYLHHQRHLAAHPLLSQYSELISPNKDEARALIRNALEIVLDKPPFFSKEIVAFFVEDLSARKDDLATISKLELYLQERFLKRMNEQTIYSLIKAMWKFVFKLVNTECEDNRLLNYRTLSIIIGNNLSMFVEKIQDASEKEYFVRNLPDSNNAAIVYLFDLLCDFPNIFSQFPAEAQKRIIDKTEVIKHLNWVSYFQYNNFDQFFEALLAKIKDSENGIPIGKGITDAAIKLFRKFERIDDLYLLFIIDFGKSKKFDTADNRYNCAIAPYLPNYNSSLLIELLKQVNSNDQIYGRRLAPTTFEQIKGFCDSKGVNYSSYDNFNAHLA